MIANDLLAFVCSLAIKRCDTRPRQIQLKGDEIINNSMIISF